MMCGEQAVARAESRPPTTPPEIKLGVPLARGEGSEGLREQNIKQWKLFD